MQIARKGPISRAVNSRPSFKADARPRPVVSRSAGAAAEAAWSSTLAHRVCPQRLVRNERLEDCRLNSIQARLLTDCADSFVSTDRTSCSCRFVKHRRESRGKRHSVQSTTPGMPSTWQPARTTPADIIGDFASDHEANSIVVG